MRRAGSLGILLFTMHLFTWLSISVALPIPQDLSAFEMVSRSDPFEKLTHSLSSKELRNAVKKAPERLRLGQDNFLYSGLKRKSVAGAYGTSAAVALGGVAITYQGMNLRTKNRDAETKKASKCKKNFVDMCNLDADQKNLCVVGTEDAQMRKAICAALKGQRQQSDRERERADGDRHFAPSSTEGSRWDPGSEEGDGAEGQEHAYLPSRPTSEWDKRALSDATLNTIEDYNKFIGATEAIASGTIAMISA
ncbi:uncharacterized protein UTRI_02202 [Ustilago trichophora]|uniref:Uncharacterized protein n=1 Tax=Ustilago trichophora TaxID=86804 RepID=A0A5C3DYM6_9BASI|nr:uncharacterized protein UTRI_02202 [Ustilago trichophora]